MLTKHRFRFPWELFCIVLIILSTTGVIAAVVIAAANDNGPAVSLLLTMLALLGLTITLTPQLVKRFRKRRRSAFAPADFVIKNDTRPPVLYLRSFKDDEKLAHATAFHSVEQEMCLALSEIGPVIAMAEPDKPDPVDSGAARMRIPQDDWQQKVSEEMSRAALVLMRTGHSDGLWWELSEASRRVKPQQLVLLLPAENPQLYEKFRAKACEWLPCELPEFKLTKWSWWSRGGIVYFAPDWTPHLRTLKTLWLRQTFWDRSSAVLRNELRPVYEQLGIEWKKPPVQPLQILYVLVLCLLAVLFVYLACAMFMPFLSVPQ